MNHKTAIVVPYRDRAEHLDIFLGHMEKYDCGTPFSIYIVEQYGNGKFNRGQLCNVGYLQAMVEGFTHIIFHDVDMIPHNVSYAPWEGVTHLAARATQFKMELPYPKYLGGVVMFDKESFAKINGFSNNYQGWGLEDDDLYARCVAAGVNVKWYRKEDAWHESLPHEPETGPSAENVSEYRRGSKSGLVDCDYTVVGFSDRGKVKHLVVDLDGKTLGPLP